jgi:hypothetical protein
VNEKARFNEKSTLKERKMCVRGMAGCVLTVVVLVGAGCSRGPSRMYPPTINASAAGAKAVETYDADKDGKISGAELDSCPALKAAIAQIDTGGQRTITAEMITARIQNWQESKIARMPVTCLVMHGGRPLSGADVKFVPEEFLGSNVTVASGKTNENGMAAISVPTTGPNDRSGVAPGFYRVDITKLGDNIPVKYNAKTVLGQEVAQDAKGILGMIRLDLKY